MRKYIFIACVLLVLTGCAVQNFERRHSLTYDFKRISTFAFDHRSCGIVGSPPEEKNAMIAFIRSAIESELKFQGFIPVRTHPETIIRFGLILDSNGKNLDPRTIKQAKTEEAPEYAPTFDYKPGSLVIDAADPFFNKILWRVSIDTRIKTDTPMPEKKDILSKHIKKLLNCFLQVLPASEKNK